MCCKRTVSRVLLVDTNRGETAAAKLAELPTYHGNILGEETLEEIDLGGLGRLLALTPNDEVNVLAVQRFAPLFGRASVYQLPPREGAKGRVAMAKHLAGRWLFQQRSDEREARPANRGRAPSVKATKLTEEFDYAAFRAMHGPEALPLFTITDSGRLTIRTADETAEPKSRPDADQPGGRAGAAAEAGAGGVEHIQRRCVGLGGRSSR